jgi:hypothetical protein
VKKSFYEECVFDKFYKNHNKILLADSNVIVDKEDIYKPKAMNESSHKISYDSGFKVISFATSRNLTVKSMMFTHHNIYKFIWASTVGDTFKFIICWEKGEIRVEVYLEDWKFYFWHRSIYSLLCSSWQKTGMNLH